MTNLIPHAVLFMAMCLGLAVVCIFPSATGAVAAAALTLIGIGFAILVAIHLRTGR